MAGTVKGIIVEIGGDTSGLQKALSKVNSSTSSLSKELKGVNSLLKLDPKNTEMLSQKQEVLKNNIAETSNKLAALKSAQVDADNAISNGTKISEENYRALQREIVDTQEKLSKMKAEASNWTKVGTTLEDFGNRVKNISSKLNNLGNTFTTALTMPILGIATAAITTGNDFEAQMSRVQAIAGATKDELKQLTDQAIQLGIKTTFTSTQVATGMEDLASAGFSTNEIMSAMPGLLNLAASSGADLATSSSIAASAIRGFGLEASSSSHVADVFAETAARTNAQTEDLGDAMSYVAPIAHTAGLSIEETAAAIGIMSDAGVKGSQAGTALRGGLTRIVKPTKQVEEAMKTLGVKFYDNNGKMKSLTQIVQLLQEHTKGLTDEVKNQALAQIFGTESLSGMLALVNRGSGSLTELTTDFKNCDGAAQNMADTILDNSKGAIEQLKGSLESAGIAIQQALSPDLKQLAKDVQKMTDKFTNMTDAEKENVIHIALLVATIGPALKILSKMGTTLETTSEFLGDLFKATANVTSGVKIAEGRVGSLTKALSILASPLGIAGVVAAIAIAIKAYQIYNSEEEKQIREVHKECEEIKKVKEAREELIKAQNEQASVNLEEIQNTQNLWNELKNITNENGKIKDGYEKRANFIVGELKKALGIEIGLNGDVIQNYKELQNEIDKTILKKKAQIILDSEEEEYKDAVTNKAKALSEYNKIYEEEINEAKKLKDIQNDILKNKGSGEYSYFDLNSQLNKVKELQTSVKTQKDVLNGYYDSIATYEKNSSLVASNNSKDWEKVISDYDYSATQGTKKAKDTIAERILDQTAGNERMKDLYKQEAEAGATAEENKYKNQVEAGQKRIEELADELVKQTSITEQNSPEIIQAWKNLANNSYSTYSEELSKISPDERKKIEEMTGIPASKTEDMKSSTKQLAESANNGFNDNVDPKSWGQDLVDNLVNSMTSNINKGKVSDAAIGIASIIAKFLHHSTPDEGPLKNDDEWMLDFIDNMVYGINNNKYKVINSAKDLATGLNNSFNEINLGSLQGRLNASVNNSTKMIYTTPQIVFNVQELDKAKLDQCFEYVNRKFGSKY